MAPTVKKIRLFNKLISELKEENPFTTVKKVQEIEAQMKLYSEQSLLEMKIPGYTFNDASWDIIHKLYSLSIKNTTKLNQFQDASSKVFEAKAKLKVTPKEQDNHQKSNFLNPQVLDSLQNFMPPSLKAVTPMIQNMLSKIDLSEIESKLDFESLSKEIQNNPEQYAGLMKLAGQLNAEEIIKSISKK